jgi:hypothetical protein
MSIWDEKLPELTGAELDHLMALVAKAHQTQTLGGTPEAELFAKLNTLAQNRHQREQVWTENEAKQAQAVANATYANNSMKVGDVVTLTSWETSGYGKSYRSGYKTYTIRLTGIRPSMHRFADKPDGNLNLDGVVLTKSGQPNKSLNNRGFGAEERYRHFSAVSPSSIQLVTAA